MALNIIPEARPQEAQTTPENLRLGLNLSEFRSELRHVVGSSLIGFTSAAATVGLLWTSWGTGQNEAAFFAGFTAINTYWMIAYCRAACSTLLGRYSIAYLRAETANRENAILKNQNLRLVRERSRREEGEAGEGVGYDDTSPASEVLFINPKRVN